MKHEFYKAVENRRSIYGIAKESPISDERLIELVQNAVKQGPSPMNCQSGRAILLLGSNHDKLWDTTKYILKSLVSEKSFPQTEQRINSFRNGYGTVLFFEIKILSCLFKKNTLCIVKNSRYGPFSLRQ